MSTTKLKGYTLWIHRSFGMSFIIYYSSRKDAWNSCVNIINTIELIEGSKPKVFSSWDIINGKALTESPFAPLQNLPPVQLAEFWPPSSTKVDYPIAQGDSFQLFLLKGYGLANVYDKPKNTLLLTEAEAKNFMQECEGDIEVIKTKTLGILRPVY
jgi:hypothetical protein